MLPNEVFRRTRSVGSHRSYVSSDQQGQLQTPNSGTSSARPFVHIKGRNLITGYNLHQKLFIVSGSQNLRIITIHPRSYSFFRHGYISFLR